MNFLVENSSLAWAFLSKSCYHTHLKHQHINSAHLLKYWQNCWDCQKKSKAMNHYFRHDHGLIDLQFCHQSCKLLPVLMNLLVNESISQTCIRMFLLFKTQLVSSQCMRCISYHTPCLDQCPPDANHLLPWTSITLEVIMNLVTCHIPALCIQVLVLSGQHAGIGENRWYSYLHINV